jgi:nitrogen fixation NifU-like protein
MATAHEEANLDELYREVLFEHYRRPHHRGALEGAQIAARGHNPLCGDQISVYGRLDALNRLAEVTFEGKACAICTASASLMTDIVRGCDLAQAEEWTERFKKMMRGEAAFAAPAEFPDLEALVGVKKFPVRIKCATLPWTTLRNGILAHRAGLKPGENLEACSTETD